MAKDFPSIPVIFPLEYSAHVTETTFNVQLTGESQGNLSVRPPELVDGTLGFCFFFRYATASA